MRIGENALLSRQRRLRLREVLSHIFAAVLAQATESPAPPPAHMATGQSSVTSGQSCMVRLGFAKRSLCGSMSREPELRLPRGATVALVVFEIPTLHVARCTLHVARCTLHDVSQSIATYVFCSDYSCDAKRMRNSLRMPLSPTFVQFVERSVFSLVRFA